MQVIISTCHKDTHLTIDLLKWIYELDGKLDRHSLVLLSSARVDGQTIEIMKGLANRAFGKVFPIKQVKEDERGWPQSCGTMFKIAVDWVRKNTRQPFLWLEPDAVPLKPGWLDAIEAEYLKCGKPFMGFRFDFVSATRRLPHLNGNAVYPADLTQYNPAIMSDDRLPFDCVNPQATLKHAHLSKLFFHTPGDPPYDKPWTFPMPHTLDRIPSSACIFHRVKDNSLIVRLRERRHLVRVAEPTIRQKVRRAVRGLLRGGSVYYHSGNLGDIVYALYGIKLHGGGELLLGPKQNGTHPCSNPITRQQFNWFRSLLSIQPYVHKVEYRDAYPVGEFQYDLNEFRALVHETEIRSFHQLDSLCHMHTYALGVDHLFDETDPWLVCPDPVWHGKIVVHRSRRYNASDFPWMELCKRHAKDMLFIGLEDEWARFQTDFRCSVDYLKPKSALSLAQYIAGSSAFIGNQSFPMSVAIGLGQRIFQETFYPQADCVFERENFINQRQGIKAFEKWL